MTRNILVGMMAVAGLAAAANAQLAPPAGSAEIEIRLVVDGGMGFNTVLAGLAADGQIEQFLPGPAATAVGLTFQARVRSTGANASIGNFGITGFQNLGATNLSRFEVDDSSALAGSLQRGRVSVTTGNGNALFGTFGNGRVGAAQTPTLGAIGPGNIRGAVIGSDADATTNNSNRTANLNNAASPGSTAANARNGFVDNGDAGGDGRIIGLTGTTPTNDINLTNFPSYGTEFSPWFNMYRMVYVPAVNAGTELTRNVTVSFTGGVNFAYFAGFNEASGVNVLRTFTFGGPAAAGGAASPLTTSATFQVPTPGAAALLGLGGLLAARRRRA